MRKLMGYELRKLFGRRLTQAALLAAVLFSALFTVSTYQNKYASYGGRQASGGEAVALDKEVAARYAGELTDEKVRQMMDELAPKSGPQGLNAIYLYQNAMQSAVTARFSDMYGNWNGLRVAQVFGEEEIRIGYVDGWLSASRDMEKSFLFLSFAILIMLAPVYSGEYGGVDNLILASRYGRTKCASAKALAGILAAVLVTAGMLACNVGAAYLLYGREGLDCSILFAPLTLTEGYIPFNIPCGALLGYQALLSLTGAVCTAGVGLVLSAACRTPMIAVVASAAVHIVPTLLPVAEASPLFRLLALLPVYQMQFEALMSLGQLEGGMPYAVLALPVSAGILAVGYALSRRIFAAHEVS